MNPFHLSTLIAPVGEGSGLPANRAGSTPAMPNKKRPYKKTPYLQCEVAKTKEKMSNWSSTWKTIPPLVEKMLNASLHKSIVHRHLRWGCNIQRGQSCFDLGYSNYNLTRITWAWVLRITWGLGCNFRCGGDGDGGAITIPTDARCSLHWVLFVSFVMS
jgi:hypothetical protein